MNPAQWIDHTILRPTATTADLTRVCAEAKCYGFASVCVNPCNVAQVATLLAGSNVKTCSVVGFPFGTHTRAVKLAEAEGALRDGAQEIDIVIHIGKLLDGDTAYVETEVRDLTNVCHAAGALIKVIVETCYLNEQQIATMCRIVEQAGADFIKTSTGYGTRGASEQDIILFKKYLKKPALIKASGGIRTPHDAKKYIDMGCARLGTSSGVAIMEHWGEVDNG